MLSAFALSAILAASLQTQPPESVPTQTIPSPPSTCRSYPLAMDFDFWIGTWHVKDTKTGQFAGTNRIHTIEQGCGLIEDWTAANGSTGMSFNSFNPVTDQWRQIWISDVSGGFQIDINGGLNDAGDMEMIGTIVYFGRGTTHPFKGLWTPEADGTVTQTFMIQDDDQNWQLWFQGSYQKQSE